MASGGYRLPTNPAPVSGPGALSARTDGFPGQNQVVPTGLPYGDAKQLQLQEQTAPMAVAQDASPQMPAVPQLPAGTTVPTLPPFGESQRPDEPITHGLDIGPGAGSEVLAVEHQPQYQAQGAMTQMLASLSARDTTGVLADVYAHAQALNV